MRKLVYLFELDSVRNTDAQVAHAWEVLYEEIVVCGDIVVLTFNQLVDSRLMMSLLMHKKYRESVLQLFRNGAIRLSQFGATRTPAQYLLNSIDRESLMLYTSLPVKSTQRRLIALMRRTLVYSDIAELREYLSAAALAVNQTMHPSGYPDDLKKFLPSGRRTVSVSRNRQELNDLFVEADGTTSVTAPSDMFNDLKILYYWLDAIMQISRMENIYNPCRDRRANVEKNIDLAKFLELISQFQPDICDRLWLPAINLIQKLESYRDGLQDRSQYDAELVKHMKDGTVPDPDVCRYAAAIVDLCYNFTCEVSVWNISMHYRLKDLSDPGSRSTFRGAFMERLHMDWNGGMEANERYLKEDSPDFQPFLFPAHFRYSRQLKTVVRFSRYESVRQNETGQKVEPCECALRWDIFCHKWRALWSILLFVLLSMLVIVIQFGAAYLLAGAEELLPKLNEFVTGALILKLSNRIASMDHLHRFIVFLLLSEALALFLGHFIPSLGDSTLQIFYLVSDLPRLFFLRHKGYINAEMRRLDRDNDLTENPDAVVPAGPVLPDRLKQYRSMRADTESDKFFGNPNSSIYPLADLSDNQTVQQLVWLEEDSGIHYGVVYESRYNTLLVDPIRDAEQGSFFPYERVIPSSGQDGVVILTKHGGNFVLLRQFRHAIRSEQLACPRGFTAPGQTPGQAAETELKEELRATLKSPPVPLGRLAVDSGLTSSQVHIFYVEVEGYAGNPGHEGISGYVEVPESDLDRMIYHRQDTDEQEINDSMTIGAFAMYQAYKKHKPETGFPV